MACGTRWGKGASLGGYCLLYAQGDGFKLRQVEPFRREVKIQADHVAAGVCVHVQAIDHFARLYARLRLQLDVQTIVSG
jgi:hypothetical protein